jgi:acetyl esterase
MPLDPQFRAVLDTLQAAGSLPLVRGDAAQTRAHYRKLSLSRRGPQYVPEQMASVTDLRSPGGVLVRIFTPRTPVAGTLIYLHGGGWVVGDVETHDPLCRRVANATGARVVSVDYRLAPEHPFPAALDDAQEVLEWVRAQDPDQPTGVAGDSAGASLAAALAIRARDKQIPLAVQLLLYPATDPAMTSPSITGNGEGLPKCPLVRWPSGRW